MQIKLSPNHIRIITSEAETAAKRLQRRLGLPVCDREDRLAPLVYEADNLAGTRDLLRGTLREALEDLANSEVQPDPEANADDLGIADPTPDGEEGAINPAAATGTDDQ